MWDIKFHVKDLKLFKNLVEFYTFVNSTGKNIPLAQLWLSLVRG